MNFFFENLSLLPETSAAKEHFKLVFGSGNSDLAKIRPLKNWHSPDFLSGFALWNFASARVAELNDWFLEEKASAMAEKSSRSQRGGLSGRRS